MNGVFTQNPFSSGVRAYVETLIRADQLREQTRQTEIMNQYRQSIETERGLDIEYKQHRLAFAKKFPQQVFGDKPTQIFTPGRVAQTLGELESGGATSMLGFVIPFGTSGSPREDAINHVLRKLGPNWEELAPNAKEIIDRKWPGEEPIQIPERPSRTPEFGQTPFAPPETPPVSRLPGLAQQAQLWPNGSQPAIETPTELPPRQPLPPKPTYQPSPAELDEWVGDWLEAPVETEPKGLFDKAGGWLKGVGERTTDWIKSRTEYRGPAGLFPSKAALPSEEAIAPTEIKTLAKELEETLNLTPERAVEVASKKLAYDAEERKRRAARKGRIRRWVVPFNLKYGKRLQPRVLDEMADETINKLSRLSPDRLETALQAILNGTSEQELLAALALEE